MTTEKEELPQDDGDIADFDDTTASTKPEDAAPEPAAEPAKVEPEPEPTPAEPEPPSAGNPVMIPKARFDEATGALKDDLRNQTARVEALAAELAALKSGPPVDYGAEIRALDEAWNNDNFEGSHDEYIAQRDGLIVSRTEQVTREKFQEEQAQEAALREAQAWAEAANAFAKANPIYDGESAEFDAEELAALEATLQGVHARNPGASHAEKLAKAHKIVEAIATAEGRRAAPQPVNPHASRNAADAKAQASASAAPDPSAAGTGDRGRQSFPGLKDLKDKEYNALPKEVTESKSLADF